MCVDIVEQEYKNNQEKSLKQQIKFNHIIALTGSGLFLVGFINIIPSLTSNYPIYISYVISGIFGALLGIIMLKFREAKELK